jgi:hypothetical protein
MKCTDCGSQLGEDSTFCTYCGTRLDQGEAPEPPGEARPIPNAPDFPVPPYAPPPGYGYVYGYPQPPQGAGAAAPYPVAPFPYQPYAVSHINYVERKMSGMAIASMVLGIISYVFMFPLIFGIGPMIGLALGLQARKNIAASAGRMEGEGFASAGIILGLSGLILSLLFWIFVAVVSGVGG